MKKISNAMAEIRRRFSQSSIGPVGTVSFRLIRSPLFDPAVPGGLLFEASSGAQVFRIERTSDRKLKFYHWTPGIGSRVAALDLTNCMVVPQVGVQFTWHPDKIELSLILFETALPPLSAIGSATNRSFRPDRTGAIHQIGDEGIETMGVRISLKCEDLLVPTASEIWRETRMAAEILSGGKSDQGFQFDVAISNAILGGLVSGFETYCKYRFLELEAEGAGFEIKGLVAVARFKKNEKDAIINEFQTSNALRRRSFLYRIIETERRVNFQNFSTVKRAFRGSFSIDFNSLGWTALQLTEFARLFEFRHRTVHVSPLTTIYTRPGEQGHPVFANREFAARSMSMFDDFIAKLHGATIDSMRRMDTTVKAP